MKNFKITVTVLLSLIISLTLLTACAGSQLSDDFNEEEVKKATEDVISYLNNKDSESILEISTVAMQNALTEEVLEEIFETIAEGGEFEEIEDMSVGGQKDKQSEEELATAVAKAKYENKKFTYTITFTKEMKLAGLYYK